MIHEHGAMRDDSLDRLPMLQLLPPAIGTLVARGAARNLRGFNRSYRLLGGGRARFRNSYGLMMALDPTQYIDSFVIREGYYEDEVLQALLSYLSVDGDVFWDIGCNIGIHSLTASLLRPSASVYSFEPNPIFAPILLWQQRFNKIKSFTHIPFALSDLHGDSKLHIYAGNSGMSSMVDWHGTATQSIPIRCMRADAIINAAIAPPPNVIKLDVEGHELEVLRGFGDFISSPNIRCIVFEDAQDNETVVKEYLSRHFFLISELPRASRNSAHNLDNFVALRG